MTYRRRILGLLITGALATAFTMVAGQPANAAAFFQIRNLGNGSEPGLCIQPNVANPTGLGEQLMQEGCNGSTEQKWAINSLGNRNYQFVNQATGGCMDAHGRNANGTPVDTFACSTISNQRWTVAVPIPNDFPARIVSAVGGRCLDVAGGSVLPDALIQIFQCTDNNPAQAWLIQPV